MYAGKSDDTRVMQKEAWRVQALELEESQDKRSEGKKAASDALKIDREIQELVSLTQSLTF